MKKGDYIVILLLIIISAFVFVFNNRTFKSSTNHRILQIVVNGKVVDEIDLSKVEEKEIKIHNKFGKNTIVIDRGQVHMEESDCKDRVCIKMGSIRQPGDHIVCLPNRLILKIISDNEDDLDVVIK
ncbi:MAG: NusG domain II-containing protein [Tissierellia bacterium]|nr:NusG domain II-containing protein [Tissierellia bacterium]